MDAAWPNFLTFQKEAGKLDFVPKNLQTKNQVNDSLFKS
jgi:hypothetical protein